MTTLTQYRLDAALPDRPALTGRLVAATVTALVNLWHNAAARIDERRTIVQLSRKSPRLLRDMGFRPDAIFGAIEDPWGDRIDPRS